jgi:hypothetical protein
MTSDPLTSISIHASTLRMLQPFKKGDMTWDDVILDFLEDHVPTEFVEQMVRASEREPHFSLDEVLRENHLPRKQIASR